MCIYIKEITCISFWMEVPLNDLSLHWLYITICCYVKMWPQCTVGHGQVEIFWWLAWKKKVIINHMGSCIWPRVCHFSSAQFVNILFMYIVWTFIKVRVKALKSFQEDFFFLNVNILSTMFITIIIIISYTCIYDYYHYN